MTRIERRITHDGEIRAELLRMLRQGHGVANARRNGVGDDLCPAVDLLQDDLLAAEPFFHRQRPHLANQAADEHAVDLEIVDIAAHVSPQSGFVKLTALGEWKWDGGPYALHMLVRVFLGVATAVLHCQYFLQLLFSQEIENFASHPRLLRQTETVGCAYRQFVVTLGNRHATSLRSQKREYETDREEAAREEEEGGQHRGFSRRWRKQIARSCDQGETQRPNDPANAIDRLAQTRRSRTQPDAVGFDE